jgi:hypothetical protein
VITAEIGGLADIGRNLGAIGRLIEAAALKEFTLRAQDMHRDIGKKIGNPGGGRIYTTVFFMRGGKLFVGGPRSGNNLSPSHQASRPDKFPAADTGGLRRSLVFVPFKKDGAVRVANISARAKYAKWLEYGTQRMAPRPFFRPAARFHFPIMKKAVRVAIRLALRNRPRA